MTISSTDLLLVGLLMVIASQTSYTSYRLWRDGSKTTGAQKALVDTSVLMDGRIVAIAETGFLPGTLVIPRSVVGELQFLADNADSDKRERARRGLDVIKHLQDVELVHVELLQDGSRAREGVDERLLALAKKHGMSLCTIDFNLNKVAKVEGITVLNVNELARNLRMTYLPGDRLQLELTTGGSDSHQAVGHLDDGTMVVVEQARSVIGTQQEVEIIRSLQTAAGKMMFARLTKPASPKPSSRNTKNSSSNGKKVHSTQRSAQPKTSEKAAASTQATAKPNRSNASSQRARRKTNEDRLLDLVDAQVATPITRR